MAILYIKSYFGRYHPRYSMFSGDFILFEVKFDDRVIVREVDDYGLMAISIAGLVESLKGTGRYTIGYCCCCIDGCGGFYEPVPVRHKVCSDGKKYVVWLYGLDEREYVRFEYEQYRSAISQALNEVSVMALKHPDYQINMDYGSIKVKNLAKYVNFNDLELILPD